MIPIDFAAPLWLWQSNKSAWHFVTLPPDAADAVRMFAPRSAGGFGSVRVRASIGDTAWNTSVFPSRGHASFLLPVKKAVRSAQGLAAGDTARVTLEVEL